MRITVLASLILGLALCAKGETVGEDDESLFECIADDDTMGCLRSRLARSIDQIEMQVTGKTSETPMSAVIERAGNFVAELVDDVQNPEPESEQEEGRGKHGGKKRKKNLQKLLGLAMLIKAKISLLLQLITTHFQVKFFVIAVLGLIINAARFWIDLKKSPSKVIYYEHAQHQHHYDHDDHDSGYWGRSSNDSPQDLAYSAYAPQSS